MTVVFIVIGMLVLLFVFVLGLATGRAMFETVHTSEHPYARGCPCGHDQVYHSVHKCTIRNCACQRTAGEVVALLEGDRPKPMVD